MTAIDQYYWNSIYDDFYDNYENTINHMVQERLNSGNSTLSSSSDDSSNANNSQNSFAKQNKKGIDTIESLSLMPEQGSKIANSVQMTGISEKLTVGASTAPAQMTHESQQGINNVNSSVETQSTTVNQNRRTGG